MRCAIKAKILYWIFKTYVNRYCFVEHQALAERLKLVTDAMNATNIVNTNKIADRDLRIELDNMEMEDLRARAVMIIEEDNLERQERKIIIDNQ